MTGHKSLTEVRAELEAVLGAGPVGEGHVAESLRRFLAVREGGRLAEAIAAKDAAQSSPAQRYD